MADYNSRLRRLQDKMRHKGIDGCIVTQNVDLYYFTGSMQSGYLFIPVEGDAVYYVQKSVVRARAEAGVAVESLGTFRTFGERMRNQFARLFGNGRAPVIALEFDVLPVQYFRRLQSVLPDTDWVDGSMLIRETRMIKSPDEIAKIKEAARIADKALEKAVARLRVGMSEVELMSVIEQSLRLEGHLGVMRMRGYNQEIVTGIVGSGAAAAVPTYFDGPAGGQGLSPACPQSAGRKRIERNEPILLDIGCCIDGYVIDQTRTAVIGELPDDLTDAYAVSEQIMRETEALLRPGTISEQLYFRSLERAEAAGLGAHFMGYGDDRVKFLGHGIGLEVDELPVLAKGFKYPLEAGMVIAVEPKFTFPNRGVVGIENSYVVTENGFDKLTVSQEGIIRVQG